MLNLDVNVNVKPSSGGGRMRIGELARQAGVSERALRYYEEHGLLAPARRQNGYRVYSDADIAVVRRIRILLAAGLSTAQILEVLPCVVDDDGQLTPGCSGLVDLLMHHRDKINTAINELETTRANIEKIISSRERSAS